MWSRRSCCRRSRTPGRSKRRPSARYNRLQPYHDLSAPACYPCRCCSFGDSQAYWQDVMTDETVVSAPVKGFWSKVWRLTWPYFRSEEWRSAWVLLVAVVALSLGRVYI